MIPIKLRVLALALAGSLLLTSCASLLERSYETSSAHVDKPTTAEDSSILRVENYRELVSAVLYLVAQGQEEGTIQLYDYDGEVEQDLNAACLEVATEDPLGAYAVDYIKHESSRVVSYYQAAISIGYRRTQEQVRSMVNVTGSGAIRAELREALAEFRDRVVLRVAYFSEDEDSIARLIRQAYYDAPASALGMPTAEISLYPDSGRERVVEIVLTYPGSAEDLREKSQELTHRAEEAVFQAGDELAAARLALAELFDEDGFAAAYDPEGGSTPYDALMAGKADDEGLALAYALLCRQGGPACEVVEGTLDGAPRFWNVLTLSTGETFYTDPSRFSARSSTLYDEADFFELGYRWPGGPSEEPPEAARGAEEGKNLLL